MELYSFDRYKKHCLFVEDTRDETYPYYEGVLQYNGTTIFECKALSPEKCLGKLKESVDGKR